MAIFRAFEYQTKTYLAGEQGKLPLISPDWAKLEQQASEKMTPDARSYIVGGAGLQQTINNNRSGFDKYKIVPRMLRNVENRDTSTEILSVKMPSPFFLCPIGVAEMVHLEGDLAIARGAAPTGIPYIFSNQASFPMEMCAKEMGETPFFFQLYWSKSRELVANFVRRAEACGAKGIVLTLDTTLLGWRTQDLDIAFLPFLQGKGIKQYTSDPVFMKMALELTQKENVENLAMDSPQFKQLLGRNCVRLFTQIYTNSTTTWEDLAFLRGLTKLPILLKGILHPDDARLAVEHGMDGIIVSNHGGRQVDGAISTIEALPAIVATVKKRIPVLLDSGIRGGADVFKALALGADAVGLGRPHVYGLTLAGAEGVTEVIRQLQADFELTMALAGCKNISEINKKCVIT
ncbi:MAG: lactate 2-monooxygenase [Saprospiraceae bacterium]|nr:lactate 2-monooxygenase [Saprospiraceae bacterium]